MNSREADQYFPGEYRLDVEDFGPIAKASVDLRPLTVFIGPSNTGKSYLAILFYALHRCFGGAGTALYGRRTRYRDELMRSLVRPLLDANQGNDDILHSFERWLSSKAIDNTQNQLSFKTDNDSDVKPGSPEEYSESWPEIPKNLDSYIRSVFERSDGLDRHPKDEIGRCFGIEDMSLLIRHPSSASSANIKVSIPRKSDAGMVQYELLICDDSVDFMGRISGEKSLSNEIDLDAVDDSDLFWAPLSMGGTIDRDVLGFSLGRIAEEMLTSLLRPLYRGAYYLPADRTGIMHSHQVVVSALLQSATTAGLRRSPDIPILSGVLADFLDQLIEMSGERGHRRSRSERHATRSSELLAKRLERDVLKGAVRMENVGSGYPSFDYLPDGWHSTLPLMRASSMVSELAPVVLYLRHLVRPGDVLVIEEPESHLHPAMQVALTRQLAALVRAGIRVIVTTHSEWLLQELANLVRASQLPESERAGIAGGDVALNPSQVGAWLFQPNPTEESSTVRPIGLDESGLYPSDFEDVAVAMHNEWAEISSRLGDDG